MENVIRCISSQSKLGYRTRASTPSGDADFMSELRPLRDWHSFWLKYRISERKKAQFLNYDLLSSITLCFKHNSLEVQLATLSEGSDSDPEHVCDLLQNVA